MSDPNEDLKNKLGNEYDLYSGLKDKFQGFDKEGNATFDDEGKVSSFSKNDFAKMNEQLKKDFGDKSYEDTFNQNQYKDLANSGNKFQGFAGDQAIFRNEKGDLENFGNQGGFASFLKKQQPNAQFDISKQGQSQRTSNSYNANLDFLGQKQGAQQKTNSGFSQYVPQKALANTSKNLMNPAAATDDAQEDTAPDLSQSVTPPSLPETPGGTFESFKTKQTTKSGFSQPVSKNPNVKKKAPPRLGAPAPTLGGMATGMLQNQAEKKLGDVQDQASMLGNEHLQDATGTNVDFASLANGNISNNVQNLAKKQVAQQATQQGQEFLDANDPTGGALSGAMDYKNLLNGNIAQNVQNLAKQQLSNTVKNQATSYLSSIDPTGGMAVQGLNAAKSLTGGGSVVDKGQAAGQLAARAAAMNALGAATGGMGYLANPELLQGAAGLTDKLGQNLGPAGFVTKPGSIALTAGAKGLNAGLDLSGKVGGEAVRGFKNAGEGVAKIGTEGLDEVAKAPGAVGNLLQKFLQNPGTIAKGIGNAGKAAVAKAADVARAAANAVSRVVSWVCFTPDTEILMANGKYKKIKQIKLGEEVMLGGKVTAIGTAMAKDLYLYDGVEVSEGHALYENGIWLRVEDSRYAVKIDQDEEFLVYPMATENHLVVTKGQIWADIMETDDKHNQTEDGRIQELNNQKHANSLLDMFLKSYFTKKKK
jgi:hypothetical protein